MRNVRQAIAVACVATALCGDRLVATPAARPEMSEMAGRLVERLAAMASRQVAVRIYASPVDGRPIAPRRLPARPVVFPISARSFSPFQFRLPPPTQA